MHGSVLDDIWCVSIRFLFFSSDVVVLYVRCRKVRQVTSLFSICLEYQGVFIDFYPYTGVHGFCTFFCFKKCEEKTADLCVRFPWLEVVSIVVKRGCRVSP